MSASTENGETGGQPLTEQLQVVRFGFHHHDLAARPAGETCHFIDGKIQRRHRRNEDTLTAEDTAPLPPPKGRGRVKHRIEGAVTAANTSSRARSISCFAPAEAPRQRPSFEPHAVTVAPSRCAMATATTTARNAGNQHMHLRNAAALWRSRKDRVTPSIRWSRRLQPERARDTASGLTAIWSQRAMTASANVPRLLNGP